jgi:uncharacterized protein YndB with AHSA1/START domain
MPRTDRMSRVIAAPPEQIYAAMVDREALETWLPPQGMTARFERFDAHAGGSYRLVLTYEGRGQAAGKATADSDVVEARYVSLVPGVRVVQEVDFESDDPAFAGTMTMTWEISPTGRGTRVTITAEDVPDGISFATARDASTLDYRTIMVADANAARRDQDLNATLYTVYRSFGDVRTTDELVTLIDQVDCPG